MNLPVDTLTEPVNYDTTTQTFNIYTEDRTLIGFQDYACQAQLVDYPTTVSVVEPGQIEIIDPCLNPNEIQVLPQTPPPDYYYTGEYNPFELEPFATWPPGCAFE